MREVKFFTALGTLKLGERAIATHSQYGTSERAINAVICSVRSAQKSHSCLGGNRGKDT